VPVELALHHPYQGLVMVWTEATGGHAVHDAWAEGFRQGLTGDGSPVGQVVTFRPIELPDPLPRMPGAIIGADPTRDVRAHCCFVDVDLRMSWREVAGMVRDALDAAHASSVSSLLVAPFVPSITGTDAYLDELW